MTAENGAALGEVKSTRPCGVDVHGLHLIGLTHHTLCGHSALQEYGLLAVIDEHVHCWVVLEHQMRRLRCVKCDITVVNDEHVCTQPVSRQAPPSDVLGSKGVEAAAAEGGHECRVLAVENLLTLCHDHRHTDGIRDIGQEELGECEGLGQLLLHGLMGDVVQHLTHAAVLVGWIVPAVHTVDVVEPEGDLSARVEPLPGLNGCAARGVDGACRGRPVLHCGCVVVNAVHRERTASQPGGPMRLGNGHIQQQHMASLHLRHLGPSVGLARGDGEHIDWASCLEGGVGDVGREPSVDTVPVKEQAVSLGLGRRRGSGNCGSSKSSVHGSRHLGIGCKACLGLGSGRATTPYSPRPPLQIFRPSSFYILCA